MAISALPQNCVHMTLYLCVLIVNLSPDAIVHAGGSARDMVSALTLEDPNAGNGGDAFPATSSASAQHDVRLEDEVRCLALNIYFEARSEPEEGQHAVGHVVMNRVADRDYPSTACDVVRQGGERRLYRCQFSWWCDGRSDNPLNDEAWQYCLEVARAVYLGRSRDPTQGALWYHAEYVSPYWSRGLSPRVRIGQHIFYVKDEPSEYALR
jgi:spore germination cell wall hydrolase CwlJ-like protein